jgi:hypothetical protein
MRRVVLLAVIGAALAGPVAANTIERACEQSDRRAASRALCSCIQDVADQMLTRSDQRKGAKFFSDPQRAQDTRQSDNSSNESFWKKWKEFGTAAGNICG